MPIEPVAGGFYKLPEDEEIIGTDDSTIIRGPRNFMRIFLVGQVDAEGNQEYLVQAGPSDPKIGVKGKNIPSLSRKIQGS